MAGEGSLPEAFLAIPAPDSYGGECSDVRSTWQRPRICTVHFGALVGGAG
jgi:hypothetical protein